MKSSSKVVLSVVIPHYNQPDNLRRCIDSLASQTIGRHAVEIIVVDNGSTMPIDYHLKTKADKWLTSYHANNPYVCRNIGVEAASSDLILVLDAGTFLKRNAVANALSLFEDITIEAIPLDIQIETDGCDIYELFYKLSHIRHRQTYQENRTYTTAGVFIRKSAFEKVGLYSTESRSGGDIKWSTRALELGVESEFSTTVQAHHTCKSRAQVKKAEQRFGRGAYLQRKDQSKWFHLKMVVYHLLPDRPARIHRSISFQDNPEIFQQRLWALWWVTWHTNLLFLTGYLSGIFFPNKDIFLD